MQAVTTQAGRHDLGRARLARHGSHTQHTQHARHARELLAGARLAVLHTGGAEAHDVRVELADDADLAPGAHGTHGLPLVWLEGSASAVADLARCRVATLVVGDPGSPWRLRLVVSLRMCRPDETGRRAYEPVVLSVRLVGPRSAAPVTVPVAEFLRAAPDAAAVAVRRRTAHLQARHGADLLAAARVALPGAEDVVLLDLRADKVDLAVLTASGVARLSVPAPSCR